MSRKTLKEARENRSMTQQNMADYLSINLRYYQKIESGSSNGAFWVWDALEDLLGVHQRKLREISNIRHVQEENRNDKELNNCIPVKIQRSIGSANSKQYDKGKQFQTPKIVKNYVEHRDNYTCHYCGGKENISIDHLIPRSRGGTNNLDNLVACCI